MENLVRQLSELWGERSRVGLVALGVLWGTLSLAILLAFGSEMVAASTQTLENFGTSLLRFQGGTSTVPYRGLPAGRSIRLQIDDADALAAAVPGIVLTAAEYSSGGGNPIEYDGKRLNVPLSGATPNFGKLRRHEPVPGGRFFNELDEKEQRNVAFLGSETKERLFGSREAVGETVKIWGTNFLVVGVLRSRITASSYNGDDREKVTIPASTYRDLRGRDRISNLWIQFEDPEKRSEVFDAAYRVLAARHEFDPDDQLALRYTDHVEIEELVHTILDGNRIFTLLVGLIGLVVAIVGVANVTYAMVEERSREIGVLMALGARPREIARERIVESVLVTCAGGIAGLALAAALLVALEQIDVPPEVRAYFGRPRVSWALGAGVIVALMVSGCLAGWYPARRAARMNPVDALHEE